MTRIVVGYDMSVEAERALDVVAGATWPAGTIVRLVTGSRGLANERSSFTGEESKRHAKAVRTVLATAHQRATTRLAVAGIAGEAVTLGGKPARAIVDDARTFGAELIVVGAPARSPILSALLGSVSNEIAQSAPCPVLIVRVASLERVILAADGSPAADAAVDVVASWPLFANAEIRVVVVAAPPSRYVDGVLSADEIEERHAAELEHGQADATSVIHATVDSLAGHGNRVTGEIRTGNAADEVVAAANGWPADLVVVGSPGGSFVRRVILGSVAQTVAHEVHASVLIVRPRPDEPLPDDAKAERR